MAIQDMIEILKPRKKVIFILLNLIALTACGSNAKSTPVTTAISTIPTNTITPSTTPTITNTPTITPTPKPDFLKTGEPFIIPAEGYISNEYNSPYPKDGKSKTPSPHSGVDIAPKSGSQNDTDYQYPVFSAYSGEVLIVGTGVKLIHPPLDPIEYPGLPAYSVCTYYGHLTGIPKEVFDLNGKGTPVPAGTLLGYMNPSTLSGIHLHFSISRKEAGACLTETIAANTVHPFSFFGLDYSECKWKMEFPNCLKEEYDNGKP